MQTFFHSAVFSSGKRAILVIDEADKILTPRYSNSEDISRSIQPKGQTMLEGTNVAIKEISAAYRSNTLKIIFVLCGAFSTKATD